MKLLDTLRALIGGKKTLSIPYSPNAWMPIISEPFAGAWQRNMEMVDPRYASSYYADFACRTLIARDMAKLAPRLMLKTEDETWEETTNSAYSPVLRKPNEYQTRNQFWETYFLSKLGWGNTYVLKERDNRGVVIGLYVLDPRRVRPLVAPDKSIFYELNTDDLNINEQGVIVPAREMIHDRFNCLYHWLVGCPPIIAGGLAAMQGLQIQSMSVRLFRNNSVPGGVLSAPGNISEDDVERIKDNWQSRFTGDHIGKVAVLGSGLKYEQMSWNAQQGQLIEQLKWTAENICSTYHVPPYKIGVGTMPSYNNVQALNLEYFSQCLQSLIEDAESCMDEALGLTDVMRLGVEFDIDNLLRMDTLTQADVAVKLVQGTIMAPNEGRKKFNLRKKKGGDSLWMQQQNFSLEALAKRDAKDDPFAKSDAPITPPADAPPPTGKELADLVEAAMADVGPMLSRSTMQ